MIRFYSLNGVFLPPAATQLQVSDLGILRGYAVFDFFLITRGVPLFLDDYLDRFYRSASLLHLEPPLSRSELQENILTLIKKNGLAEGAIRLVLTGGYATDGYTPKEANLLVLEHPFQPPADRFYQQGARMMTYQHVREFPEIKSTNYLTGIFVQKQLQAQEADFVLYHDGLCISESDRSNFAIVTQDNVIVTPREKILLGVTRKNLLAEAVALFQVEERDISLGEMRNAREAFLTSSTKGVMPIRQIDDQILGSPGPVTLKLMGLFAQRREAYLQRPNLSGVLVQDCS